MQSESEQQSARHSAFVESLAAYGRQHRAQAWEGTFGDFLATILPGNPLALARTSHQYIWDMLRWYGRDSAAADESARTRELFRRELFGIDEPLGRVVEYFKAAAAGALKGVLEYSEAPTVSIDYNGNPHSSIFDATNTFVIDGTFAKVFAWYDNEWGFSNRMVDVARYLTK